MVPGFFMSFSWQLTAGNFEQMSKGKAIRLWLRVEQDYEEGVRLYGKYGADDFLKGMFASGETAYNCKLLRKELEALLGSEPVPMAAENDAVTPSSLKKPLQDYPKAVQQLIAQAGNLFKQARKLHTELRINKRMLAGMDEAFWPYLTAEERRRNALNILKLFAENRRCWEEVNYYETHGRLHSPAQAATASLPDNSRDLKLEIFRLRPLVSKWKKRLADASEPVRRNHCERKLKAYEQQLTEAELKLHGTV
jgi:hypothetical protein